jgi:hypothetical protein
MCYNLQNNSSEAAYRSSHCYDRANMYSQMPMDKRTPDPGQPFIGAQLLIIRITTFDTGN